MKLSPMDELWAILEAAPSGSIEEERGRTWIAWVVMSDYDDAIGQMQDRCWCGEVAKVGDE